MANFSEKNDGKYHVRSISLPNGSHPTTLRIEEELNKIKTWEALAAPTLNQICLGLSGLKELYNCMDDLLNLQSTQEVLSDQRHEKWVDELLDGSVKLLDVCSITRDSMLQIKECVRDLQSALRRRKGDSSTERVIANFVRFRKKMNKDAKKLIAALKQINHRFGTAYPLLDTNIHLSSLIKVVREVGVKNISIFESLLLFLSPPLSKAKQSRWSMVSKLMNKRVVACEDKLENVNEFENVDAALCNLCRYTSSEGPDMEKMQNAHKSLEALEIGIETIENGLEGVFRRLIKTRASLLNIISQKWNLNAIYVRILPRHSIL